MTPKEELEKILDAHLNEIKAGHDGKLAAKLLDWHNSEQAKLLERVRSEVIPESVIELNDKSYSAGYRDGVTATKLDMNTRLDTLKQEIGGE